MFLDLGRCRAQTGFGISPLSFIEMVAYLDMHGIRSQSARRGIIGLVMQLDQKLVSHVSSMSESKRKMTRGDT